MRERIVELRKALKLNQAQFAESINLSRNFINLFENGNRDLSDRTIQDICRVHSVNETWLLTGEGSMFSPTTRSQKIAQLTAAFYKADDQEWADFLIEMNRILIDMTPEQIHIFKEAAVKLFASNHPDQK